MVPGGPCLVPDGSWWVPGGFWWVPDLLVWGPYPSVQLFSVQSTLDRTNPPLAGPRPLTPSTTISTDIHTDRHLFIGRALLHNVPFKNLVIELKKLGFLFFWSHAFIKRHVQMHLPGACWLIIWNTEEIHMGEIKIFKGKWTIFMEKINSNIQQTYYSRLSLSRLCTGSII